jgi:16S rRNA (guanine527-N7)-methyltransferase
VTAAADGSDEQLAAALPAVLTGAAAALFGNRLPLAARYAEVLAGDGVIRGVLGPREAPRLWERHLLNCAVVARLVPGGATVVDVGSGAGLPGIPFALARPDLTVVLLEPLARRVAFLTDTLAVLGLDGVTVVRGRAEDYRGAAVPVVTARAVAPLDRLAGWCLPLLEPGGVLLAFKGASAVDEVRLHDRSVRAAGGAEIRVTTCGDGILAEPTTVVTVTRGPQRPGRR